MKLNIYQYDDPRVQATVDDPERDKATVWIAAPNEEKADEQAEYRQLTKAGGLIFRHKDLQKNFPGRRMTLDDYTELGVDDFAGVDYNITYEHCGQTWHDVWDCACDDECPVCGKDIEALEWEEIDNEDIEP